ncbi:hypothetical protein REPUB_Repub04eG0061800 [Reevesia pubescens]
MFMLNRAWLMDYRLSVNLAKFNNRSSYWRKVNPNVEGSSKLEAEKKNSDATGGGGGGGTGKSEYGFRG